MKRTLKLSKSEVLSLLVIWKNSMKGPDPSKNKPDEFKELDKYSPNGLRFAFGTVLHLYLWFLSKIGLLLCINFLTIWASNLSIKHDNLWYEPFSCGMTNSYTDMGLGYLRKGDVENAIECLNKSWHVYPCPHNTSFGLKLKLYKKLKDYPEAIGAVTEYLEVWEQFKRW
jgi:tetratricopeptide (TPR) repeat protein